MSGNMLFNFNLLKKRILFFSLVLFLFSLSACGNGKEKGSTNFSSSISSSSVDVTNTEEKIMLKIAILVGNKKFEAELFDNATARVFAEKLPLTLDMTELNGNEKYFRFPEKFPSKDLHPDKINAGDLMLFSSSYFVIFYKDSETFYSYTPLGKIKNHKGLAKALGSGSITVTIQKN